MKSALSKFPFKSLRSRPALAGVGALIVALSAGVHFVPTSAAAAQPAPAKSVLTVSVATPVQQE